MHFGNWLDTMVVGFCFGVGFHVAGAVLDFIGGILRRSRT